MFQKDQNWVLMIGSMSWQNLNTAWSLLAEDCNLRNGFWLKISQSRIHFTIPGLSWREPPLGLKQKPLMLCWQRKFPRICRNPNPKEIWTTQLGRPDMIVLVLSGWSCSGQGTTRRPLRGNWPGRSNTK